MTKMLQGGGSKPSKPAKAKLPVPRNKPDPRIAVLRKNSIVIPGAVVIAEAKAAGIPLDLACALLDQESGGGRNAWGHDPTIFVGGFDARRGVHYGPLVTREGYEEYLKQRGPHGAGGMQGVGPCQLTYYSYQDEADAEGGCWQPRFNIRVGFRYLAANIKRYGLRSGIRAYNGSGPAAEHYADSVLALQAVWKKRLA